MRCHLVLVVLMTGPVSQDTVAVPPCFVQVWGKEMGLSPGSKTLGNWSRGVMETTELAQEIAQRPCGGPLTPGHQLFCVSWRFRCQRCSPKLHTRIMSGNILQYHPLYTYNVSVSMPVCRGQRVISGVFLDWPSYMFRYSLSFEPTAP